MSHRQRAKDRLGRHTFGWSEWAQRGPTARIRGRDIERQCAIDLLEPRVPQRDQSVERALKAATAGPNAPLLKRLVRYPYALHPVRPERREGRPADVWAERAARPTRDCTALDEARKAWVDPTAERRDDRIEHLAGEHRPSWRPHPFRKVRARQGGGQ
jgi:hypothetical protein